MSDDPPWRLPDIKPDRVDAACATWLMDRIAPAPSTVAAAIAPQGLRTLPVRALDVGLVAAAQGFVDRQPELGALVQHLVASLHPLDAKPGYDVSHSEPRWTDRILVSVPDRTDAVGAMRFAEGVVHEAMHLALTLQEEETPLVEDIDGRLASPWRGEERPYQGVMHGLFVFACLLVFFEGIVESVSNEARAHVRRRIHDIRVELGQVDTTALRRAMTPAGRHLLAAWSQALRATPSRRRPACKSPYVIRDEVSI